MQTDVRLLARRPRGFALVVTLVLVAFLVLVLVGLATFTRVETQVASNTQQLAQARQNALFALNLALGQLQRHTGPDQRVTATADLQPLATVANPSPYPVADPASGVDLSGATAATLADVDAYWRGARNRRWTGAWANGNGSAYDRENPAAHNRVPRLQAWLVSGNENSATGDAFKPTDTIAGLAATSTPLDELLDSAGRPHRLLLKNSAGVLAASDLDRAVTAPQIAITADNVPGIPGPQTVGHYAWWVGDEGVKARANLADPYFEASGAEEKRTRFQSAQRVAAERVHAGFTALDPYENDASAGDYAEFVRKLGNVLDRPQLAFLDPAVAFSDQLKLHHHDLTVRSRGVLADTKNGGLKTDLTHLFGHNNAGDFRTALRAAYGVNDIAPDATANAVHSPTATLYATLPPDPSRPYSGANGIFSQSATWEQLWSFANQGDAFDASGALRPRRQTSTTHGAYPLLIQCKLYYRLRIVGGTPDGDGVNRTGLIHVDVIPLAVVANPYAVPLAAEDYVLRISGGSARLVFGSTDNTESPSTDFALPGGNEPDYTGDVRFVLRAPRMEAGEAYVFTIDPDGNPGIGPDDRILLTGSTDRRLVYMKNDYDPVPALTFNTNRTIPADKTRVAMWSGAGQLNGDLYIDFDRPEGDRRLVQFVRGQQYTTDLGLTGGENRFLVVNPIADGIRQGGGFNLVVNQPPTSGSALPVPQQAVFAQVNYRGATVTWSGSDSTGLIHTVEWARTFSKNGSTGSAGNTPNPWIAANLLHRSGDFTRVRWGLVNIGEGQEQTVPPASIGGASATDVAYANHLYDTPRPGRPLSSLGQLQHFNVTGFIPATNFEDGVHTYATKVNSWQLNYSLSNSYPHPRVLREQVFGFKDQHGYHFDGSYLWNDLLWDRFYFSTYPQAGGFDFATDRLVNSRYKPFRDRVAVPWDDPAAFRGDGSPGNAANSRVAARNLLVEGAFNINSTSVPAWRALLSSLRGTPVGTAASTGNPFARGLAPAGGSSGAQTATTPDAWNGFRDLTDAQIDLLAQEIVLQIRRRGPFLSLSDFVNRRLVPGRTSNAAVSADPLRLGLGGALQGAIDRVTNARTDIASPFDVQAKAYVSENSNNIAHNAMRDPDYRMTSAVAGFPGYLLQADLLSALGPTLSARSDTFTIRAYGDSANPATGEVTGRAWCEAVVQRLPDYVVPETAAGGNDATATAGLHADNQRFGRRYHIVGFRWLDPEEI